MSKFVLTRRFFLVDNLSGIEKGGGFNDNVTSTTVIRYAQKLSFNVNLLSNDTAKISSPYLAITYQSRHIDSIDQSPSASIRFQSMYYMDITIVTYKIQAFFITLNVLVGLVVSIKMYVWMKNNPSELSPVLFNLFRIIIFYGLYGHFLQKYS